MKICMEKYHYQDRKTVHLAGLMQLVIQQPLRGSLEQQLVICVILILQQIR